MNTLLENIRASAILMKNLPSTLSGDALLISREEARRIGYELEACAERMEQIERATSAKAQPESRNMRKVIEHLQEGIRDATQCEDADQDHGFAKAAHYAIGMLAAAKEKQS